MSVIRSRLLSSSTLVLETVNKTLKHLLTVNHFVIKLPSHIYTSIDFVLHAFLREVNSPVSLCRVSINRRLRISAGHTTFLAVSALRRG